MDLNNKAVYIILIMYMNSIQIHYTDNALKERTFPAVLSIVLMKTKFVVKFNFSGSLLLKI